MTINHRILSALGVAGVVSSAAAAALCAQDDIAAGLGVEFQVYPSGGVFTARGSILLDDNDALFGYLGYNLAERGDNGEHASEDGGGPGLGVAWRHYLGEGRLGWHFGIRSDVWFMDIDWTDPNDSGRTHIVVLQPTAQGGYTFRMGGDWVIDVGASIGAEVNVDTDGSPVGEGAILLLGVGTEYRF